MSGAPEDVEDSFSFTEIGHDSSKNSDLDLQSKTKEELGPTSDLPPKKPPPRHETPLVTTAASRPFRSSSPSIRTDERIRLEDVYGRQSLDSESKIEGWRSRLSAVDSDLKAQRLFSH